MNAQAHWRGQHRVPALRRLAARCALLVAALLALGVVAYGWVQHPTATGPVPAPGRAGGETSQAGDAVAPDAVGTPAGRPAAPAPTTPEAMLELLSQLLPPVQVGSVAGHRDRAEILVDADLVRGRAQNRLRVVLLPDVPAEQRPKRPCEASSEGVRCSMLPNGSIMRVGAGEGCRQQRVSEVERRDGTRVRLELATCDRDGGREDGGRESDPAVLLSPDEFQLIAVDDQWGRTMRPELLEAGKRHYPDLPAVRDPDDPPRRRLR